MIIPYSTDAPIYYFPKATLAMIVTNVAIHIIAWHTVIEPAAVEPYAMVLGRGLHPLQWLTHNFLHLGLMHLIGNMIFLWCYGIIVEGKVGMLAFLGIYLGIGTLHGAAIQVAYLGTSQEQHVLGASAIIFGLMAIAMIWAPVNELTCFYFFLVGLRVITGELTWPIYVFALLECGLEGIEVALAYLIRHDPMSSGLLHISGAFWGLIVGSVLAKMRWVDCENWDVFSLIARRRILREQWRAREARLDRSRQGEALPKSMRSEIDRPGASPEERAAKLLKKLHGAIDAGDAAAAQAGFAKWLSALGNRAPADELKTIIQRMHEQKFHAASVGPMRAFCRIYPEKADKVRLKLAAVLVKDLERPTEAQRHLQQVREERIDEPLRRARRKLLEEANRMIEDGVLEVEEDA
jgi:membrane associated rhomboid family serine protease